jgi:choline kinase
MSDKPTKAIIIAAGRGRRLGPNTEDIPKCLVPVTDASILEIQLAAFRAHGIEEVVMIRGYLGDVLEERIEALGDLGLEVRYVDNPDYTTNNILHSLFYAEHEIDGPALITYSDIIFTNDVVGALMSSTGDMSLVIDRDFALIYEGRDQHPLSEAEVSDLTSEGQVLRVGKRALPADEAWGEFIGLMKVNREGAAWMREAWTALSERYRERWDEPFQRADRFRNAYLTDLLQHLIDAGRALTPVEIRGRWREIDTVQDLERARELLQSAQEEWR